MDELTHREQVIHDSIDHFVKNINEEANTIALYAILYEYFSFCYEQNQMQVDDLKTKGYLN